LGTIEDEKAGEMGKDMRLGHIDITVDGAADLAMLFERVLMRVFEANEDVAEDADAFLAGFATGAADVPALLRATVAEAAALAEEQGAGVLGCSVSGVMATDEGHRAWGFLTLTGSPGGNAGVGVDVERVAVEQVGRGRWRATATVRRGRGHA
jgi:hypothetical protein